jgi:hypothetical protein
MSFISKFVIVSWVGQPFSVLWLGLRLRHLRFSVGIKSLCHRCWFTYIAGVPEMELSSELSDQAVLQSFKMRGIPGSLTADGVAAIKRQLWKEADQNTPLILFYMLLEII